MVRMFIDIMLGRWGMAVLEFYKANSLPINAPLLAYCLLLTFSWGSLARIRTWLVMTIVSQLQVLPNIEPDAKLKRVLCEIEIPWEQAVERRFPFVAKRLGLWPRRVSVEVLQELLPSEELALEALEAMALGGLEVRS